MFIESTESKPTWLSLSNDDTDGLLVKNQSSVSQLRKKIKRLAEAGDLICQYKIGEYYISKKKYCKAVNYYKFFQDSTNLNLLASSFYPDVENQDIFKNAFRNYLASLYYSGIGGELNYKKAIELFKESALNGSSDAFYTLGQIKENCKKFYSAKYYYIQASSLNHLNAILRLYRIYRSGLGDIEADEMLAIRYLTQAAEINNVEALEILGQYYRLKLYKKFDSAVHNHIEFIFHSQQSIKNFIKAHELKSELAAGFLGSIYEITSEDGIKDIKKAINWYKLACQQDHLLQPELCFFNLINNLSEPNDIQDAIAIFEKYLQHDRDKALKVADEVLKLFAKRNSKHCKDRVEFIKKIIFSYQNS